jgi:hypothetical protein
MVHSAARMLVGQVNNSNCTQRLTEREAGGNEVLPPLWHQFEVLDGTTQYQDDTLIMTSFNRPLPGVRLGE